MTTNSPTPIDPRPRPAGAPAPGGAFSLRARLRARSGQWQTAELVNFGATAPGSCRLCLATAPDGVWLRFELRTDWHDQPLQLGIPAARLDPAGPHDVVARYTGPRLELFVDGVLVDEEWPIGSPQVNAAGNPDVAPAGPPCEWAEWFDRALADDDIVAANGGATEVARRALLLLGAPARRLQYWKPAGHNAFVGDCMPFYHDGRFHLFYLFDRRHHHSKWRLGAHQWAHASTTDLVTWDHHPMAVPITEQWEGSICTGSTFYWDGAYYAFYATRANDGSPAPLQAAVSRDGIHFAKTPPLAVLTAPYEPAPARDPVVFHDQHTGLFHMLVTTELTHPPAAGHGGCLAQLVSADLAHWEQRQPFIVPGYPDQPECADYFAWRGWYYLILSSHGVARYRMSRQPHGPWLRPAVDTFDGPQLRVMKTAAFHGDRRIGAGFLAIDGYAGQVVFREIIQHPDGTLGACFPAEMEPATGAAIPGVIDAVAGQVAADGNSVHVSAWEGFGAAALDGLPRNARITCRVIPRPGSSQFGLCLRGAGNYQGGWELRCEPGRGKVGWRPATAGSIIEHENAARYAMDGLDRPFTLDVVTCDDILDVCIDGRRTLVTRAPADLAGDRLFCFVQNGEVAFEQVEVRAWMA